MLPLPGAVQSLVLESRRVDSSSEATFESLVLHALLIAGTGLLSIAPGWDGYRTTDAVLGHIGRHATSLTALDISESFYYTEQGLYSLHSLHSLRTLNLGTVADLPAAAIARRFSRAPLTTLTLSCDDIEDLALLPHLLSLTFTPCSVIHEDDFGLLPRQLTHLALPRTWTSNTFGISSTCSTHGLSRLPRGLTSLDLSHVDIDDEALRLLPGILPGLQSLVISDGEVEGEDFTEY
jgi:hypothetical protein